jgi:hypothetical protein
LLTRVKSPKAYHSLLALQFTRNSLLMGSSGLLMKDKKDAPSGGKSGAPKRVFARILGSQINITKEVIIMQWVKFLCQNVSQRWRGKDSPLPGNEGELLSLHGKHVPFLVCGLSALHGTSPGGLSYFASLLGES